MYLLSLPTSTSAGRPGSRSCLVKRKYTDAVEAPCAPVVSSAKDDKIIPVAAQMASYLGLAAICACEDVIAGIAILLSRLVANNEMADERILMSAPARESS